MRLEEIPILIALTLSLFGMASLTWYKLHRTMAGIYLVIIIFTQLYFKPPTIPLGFLPYAGALLSGCVGVYLGFFANIYPEKIKQRQGIFISVATISLLFLFVFEAIAGWADGYIYNHIDEEHYLLYKYSPFMLWSTILQSIILLAGGINGGQRIISMVNDWSTRGAWPVGNKTQNISTTKEFQEGRKELW